MGRIINPSEIKKTTILDDLITKIIKGDVVLILGHEHILQDHLSGGDLLKQMTNDFFAYKREKNKDFNSVYQSFNDYYYRGADLTVMKQEIAESISNENYSFLHDDYSPIVYELLKKKCFRVVLTTTFDYYAETIMREIWGDKLRVLNIFDDKNDFDEEEAWRTDIQPTLYYVFGKAERGKEYTVVERDAMNVIQKWLADSAPKHFCKYINNRSLLALGTKFDDWLFRFFWYAMHRDIKRLNEGQVAISLQKESEVESRLSNFLENEGIPNSSINEVVDLILHNIDNREIEFRKDNGQYTDVFISYASSSYDTVKHLFYSLQSEGLKVWFDQNDLNAGDAHKQKIIDAINKCKIFIPVITNPVREILAEQINTDISLNEKSPQFHYFRDVEWSTARSRWILQKNGSEPDNKFMILPFCMDGLTMKDISIQDSQKELVDFVTSSTAGDNRTLANYKKFLSNLKAALK
jgi:hypothetical protein